MQRSRSGGVSASVDRDGPAGGPEGIVGDGAASTDEAEQVPPVVAVVVTRDPGPWLEETLAALGAQDYPALSVLVLDAASAEDPTPRVAAVLPEAFVRRLDRDGGFGANVNHVIDMVHGAPLLLLCHDDVAPDPDAVHVLVEEAYRSNAGVVAPKQVGWADPTRLLHVGMAVDRTGAVVDRVLPLELDHGQHDAVRDVFVAPGGCTLVRADLFASLGGFDPLVVGMGEDLDFCWRAQLAGARVVVAPAARVRHLELVAGGLRALPVGSAAQAADAAEASTDGPDVAACSAPSAVGAGSAPGGSGGAGSAPGGSGGPGVSAGGIQQGPSLQELQRRHELYTILKAYDAAHLARVLPQALVLAIAEVVVALLTGHRHRAVAVVRAWRWNLAHLAAVRAGRAAVARVRHVDDHVIRRQQVRGSARLTTYVRRATTYGIHVAHLDPEELIDPAIGLPAPALPGAPSGPTTDAGGGVGAVATAATVADGAASDGRGAADHPASRAEAEGVDDPGASGPDGPVADHTAATSLSERLLGVVSLAKADVPDLGAPPRSTEEATRQGAQVNRSLQLRGAAWTLAVVVGLYGSRSLLTGRVPDLGQLVAMPSWSALWHQWWAGWHPAGGVGATAAASGGFAVLGVLATVVFGASGLAHTLAVLGCVPIGALGVHRLTRRWDSPRARLVATVVYAAVPLAANDLATGAWTSLVVYAAMPWVVRVLARANRLEPNGPTPCRDDDPHAGWRRWRHGPAGCALTLGLLDALVASLAPPVLAVTLVVTAGLVLGGLAVGGWGTARSAARTLGVGVGGVVLALVLLLPWSVAVLSSGQRWQVLFGPRLVAATQPNLPALLRFADGPVGHTPLAYGLVVVAAVPLLVGGRWRFGWATRLWSIALVSWGVAWVTDRGWMGPLSLPLGALLAPAAVALALGAGLAVVALEVDLPRYRFGWRQVLSVVGGLAVVASVVPVLGAAGSGRWDLPSEGWGTATAFMAQRAELGQFRVLWLGDPQDLPGRSVPVEPGLAATVSQGPVPTLDSVLTVPDAAPLAAVDRALLQAQAGGTVQVGQALAALSIRYVVVAEALAPTVLGYVSPVASSVPSGLVSALERQIDLQQLSTQSGYAIFEDPTAPPERALAPPGSSSDPSSWRAVLPGAPGADAFSGVVPAGTLHVAVGPADRWTAVDARGQALTRVSTTDDQASFDVPTTQLVAVHFDGSPLNGVAAIVELLLVLAALAALAGRRRAVDWWWGAWRRRSIATGRRPTVARAATTSGPGSGASDGVLADRTSVAR